MIDPYHGPAVQINKYRGKQTQIFNGRQSMWETSAWHREEAILSEVSYVMKTFFSFSEGITSPVRRSLTWPSGKPALRAYSSSRLRAYTLPLGSMSKSCSTWLWLCWAYGTSRASSLSSVEQMGHTELVRLVEWLGVDELLACELWQAGVLRADRPDCRAMCRRGKEGRPSSVLCVSTKRPASLVHREGW